MISTFCNFTAAVKSEFVEHRIPQAAHKEPTAHRRLVGHREPRQRRAGTLRVRHREVPHQQAKLGRKRRQRRGVRFTKLSFGVAGFFFI
jgi:hypothetical protein